jgi:lysine 2-monooxygenase
MEDHTLNPFGLIDVAIIGGGASGAYTGYRLLKTPLDESPVLASLLHRSGQDRLNVRLFEWSDRIGGRLWSVNLPGLPNVPAEVGGMRFLESMENVYGLCSQELGLDIASLDFADNIQYVRAHRFSFSDYGVPAKVPYFLTPTEQGKNPIELVAQAIDELVPEAKGKTGYDLISCLRNARVAVPNLYDQPLYETGFWSLLLSKLSVEAYHLVQDASGYFSVYNNQSSYGAFLDFIRGYADKQYRKLVAGYEELPRRLVQEFQQMGGHVERNTRLYNLKPQVHHGERVIQMTLGQPGGTSRTTCYARHVVLALPQRSLQLLDPDSFIFEDEQFRADVETVRAQPASKMFLSFDEPWWQKLSPAITNGRSDTDFPFRQCYYVGTETTAPSAGMSLLMASYNDGMADWFWDTYLKRSRFGAHHPPYLGRHGGAIDSRMLAPHDMVAEVRRQLTEMHDYPVPEPVAAIYHNWEEDPIGAGWYFWNPHVRPWEVAPRIRQPVPGQNVYVCGSCYSENQGWVEGALNTAEMVLETRFGLPRPSWVSSSYYMGP